MLAHANVFKTAIISSQLSNAFHLFNYGSLIGIHNGGKTMQNNNGRNENILLHILLIIIITFISLIIILFKSFANTSSTKPVAQEYVEKPTKFIPSIPNNAKRPYYGMSVKYIDKTEIGPHKYKQVNPVGHDGMDYTFIIDSNHAMLVKTQEGYVTMVQYIENGKKVLWSETSTGIHSFR